MCFGIRILSPFHLATQIVSIQNLNCPKTLKMHARTWFLEWSSIHVKCSCIFAKFSSIFAKFSSMNVEFIQHAYPTSAIFIKCLLWKVNQGGHFEKWFSCRKVASAKFCSVKTSNSSSLLYFFSQQEIVYSTLSYEFYHQPTSCLIVYQNTDCATSLMTCNQQRRHSFTS